MQNSTKITQYLQDWRNGNVSALDEIVPLIYAELQTIARRYLRRENAGHTLQTTEVINEAYLKLIAQNETDWQNRNHFFAVAARVIRHLLIDHARAKNYQKRGSGAERVELDEIAPVSDESVQSIIDLHEALERLEKFDDRKARIVELRYFGGLSAAETGEVLGVSEITVKREWLKAKAWLFQELTNS